MLDEGSTVDAFDGSDSDSDVTDNSIFVTVDDDIRHPDQPVAIYLPSGRADIASEDDDGAPKRSILTRPRAPLTKNELQRRMPPGSRFYLHRMADEPEELNEAFRTLG